MVDPGNASRWRVQADINYAARAAADWREANPDDAPNALLTVTLGSGDPVADDRQDVIDAFRRHGLEPPPLPD